MGAATGPVYLRVLEDLRERIRGGRGVIERMASIGIRVDQVVQEVSVRPSLRAEAAALGLSTGALALVVERVHLAAGQAVEAGDIVIAAHRFRLRYQIPVPGAQP
jgi:GntR family transcriptional regulator